MKKAFLVILLVALLAVNVGANIGKRVVAIHPVEFLAAVTEDMPEGIDIFKDFTEFYGSGEDSSIGDKILWIGQNTLNALSFPVTSSVWFFRACAAFWGNLNVLFEFGYGSDVDNGHGDLDDPNYAGGR